MEPRLRSMVVGRLDHAHSATACCRSRSSRRSCAATPTWLWILSLFINLGMWFERFVIIVPSLSHEFEPWQWAGYMPTWVDIAILCGSFGWFFMWFLLFIRQLPVMAISEIKEIVPRPRHGPGVARERRPLARTRSLPPSCAGAGGGD